MADSLQPFPSGFTRSSLIRRIILSLFSLTWLVGLLIQTPLPAQAAVQICGQTVKSNSGRVLLVFCGTSQAIDVTMWSASVIRSLNMSYTLTNPKLSYYGSPYQTTVNSHSVTVIGDLEIFDGAVGPTSSCSICGNLLPTVTPQVVATTVRPNTVTPARSRTPTPANSLCGYAVQGYMVAIDAPGGTVAVSPPTPETVFLACNGRAYRMPPLQGSISLPAFYIFENPAVDAFAPSVVIEATNAYGQRVRVTENSGIFSFDAMRPVGQCNCTFTHPIITLTPSRIPSRSLTPTATTTNTSTPTHTPTGTLAPTQTWTSTATFTTTPVVITTMASSRKSVELSVPTIAQRFSPGERTTLGYIDSGTYNCLAASTAMVLQSLQNRGLISANLSVDYPSVRKVYRQRSPKADEGINMGEVTPVTAVLTNNAVVAQVNSVEPKNWQNAVYQQLENGYPVIGTAMNWNLLAGGWAGVEIHSFVIYGLTANEALYIDPWDGRPYRMAIADFEKAIGFNLTNYWMITFR